MQKARTTRPSCTPLRSIHRAGAGIVRDAEVRPIHHDRVVEGAAIRLSKVAYTIAHSPLVKTAFFASDPTGRILRPSARSNRATRCQQGGNSLNEVRVVHNGALDADYTEVKGLTVMRLPEIRIGVDLGAGYARHVSGHRISRTTMSESTLSTKLVHSARRVGILAQDGKVFVTGGSDSHQGGNGNSPRQDRTG